MITVLEYPINAAQNMREYALAYPLEDRLSNLFEQKWILHSEIAMGSQLATFCRSQSYLMGATCADPDEHFTALMRYDINDYLALHYDAEVHPAENLKKAVTAILYLSTDDCEGSPLEFWRDNKLICSVEPKCGTLVMFTNNWLHGNPQPVVKGTRLALTCSYMSYGSFDSRENDPGRRKAYFMPTPGDEWDEETIKLRDARASSEYVHKVGV